MLQLGFIEVQCTKLINIYLIYKAVSGNSNANLRTYVQISWCVIITNNGSTRKKICEVQYSDVLTFICGPLHTCLKQSLYF